MHSNEDRRRDLSITPGTRWLARRLTFWVGVLLTIIFLVFFSLQLAREVPASTAFSHALDKSIDYLGRLIRGDLGTVPWGFEPDKPVVNVLLEVLPRSLILLALSLAFSIFVGVGLGLLSALRGAKGGVLLSTLGISMPSFALALLLQILALAWTRQFGKRLLPVGGFGWDAHMILPALVLAARPIAQIARVTQISVSEVLAEDFVRTARSKGLPSRLVWLRHVLRVAAPPILTTIGSSIRFSISSLPVVEIYFGWPGLGWMLLESIAESTDHLSVALALCLALGFLIQTTIFDIVNRRLDPRLSVATERTTGKAKSWGERFADLRLTLADLLRLRRREEMPALRSAEIPEPADAEMRSYRRRSLLRSAMGNGAFIIGAILLVLLMVLYFFGPSLARHNPYATQGLVVKDGEFIMPPFPPDGEYWFGTDFLGRDMYSMIVAGARQTLTLVIFAAGARILIGVLLGIAAGMAHDGFVDRLLSSLSQVFTALPALVVAMLLILGLGVRKGIWVFVIGVAAVGWSEVFDFIRSETRRLLGRPFVESAIACGNTQFGLAVRHLLPNLLPFVISLAALEMASVMMIVGELGFLGVFQGGGIFAQPFIGMPLYHYSDVPEWAAMISIVRQYARSYPWMALFPAGAFFFAIAAFNLFGEGLRRLLTQVGFGITRFFNRYTLAGAVALGLLVSWLSGAGGTMSTYKALSDGFDLQRTTQAIETLAGPSAPSRGIDTEGQWQAAHYLAQRLEEIGLQPAGEAGGYLFVTERYYFELTETPELSVLGQDFPLTYHQDYSELSFPVTLAGVGQGELVVLGVGEQTQYFTLSSPGPDGVYMPGPRLSDKIVLLLHPSLIYLDYAYGAQGTLVLSDDPDATERRTTLSVPWRFQDPTFDTSPAMSISWQAASDLLALGDLSLRELIDRETILDPDEFFTQETAVHLSMSVQGEERIMIEAPHVLAYWPGVDPDLDDELIVVMAPYDGLRPDVDGVRVPGAVNDASSIAVILEALQALVDGDFQPRRSFFVVFYASQGVGSERSTSLVPDVQHFLSAKTGFSSLKPEVVIWLQAAGGGDGNRLVIGGIGEMHLTQLVESAARLHHVPTLRDLDPLDIGEALGGDSPSLQRGYSTIILGWEGGSDLAGLPEDDLSALDPQAMEDVGHVVTLLLSMLAREPVY